MSQFEHLEPTKGKLTKPETLSSKKRESDSHPGIGFTITGDRPNHVLSYFDGFLKGMMFTKRDGTPKSDKDRRQHLDGMELTDLPNLSPIGQHLGTVHWKQTLAGYELEIKQGARDSNNIILKDCEIDRFVFKGKEGGSVTMAYRIEAPNVDAATNGRIQVLKDTEIEFILRAPRVQDEPQQDISGNVAPIKGSKGGGKKGEVKSPFMTPEEALAQSQQKAEGAPA